MIFWGGTPIFGNLQRMLHRYIKSEVILGYARSSLCPFSGTSSNLTFLDAQHVCGKAGLPVIGGLCSQPVFFGLIGAAAERYHMRLPGHLEGQPERQTVFCVSFLVIFGCYTKLTKLKMEVLSHD